MEIIDIKQETENLKKLFIDYLDMIAELVKPEIENPITERNAAVDSWYVRATEENIEAIKTFFSDRKFVVFIIGCFYGIDRTGKKNYEEYEPEDLFDKRVSTEEFYNKIGYTKPTENILDKGKEVLNSQNEGVFNEDAISKKLQSLTDEFITEKQNYKPKFKEGDIAKIKQVNSNMDGVKGVIKGVTKNIVIFRMDGYEHDIFIQDDYIELVKEALFVTEDGVIIFKGDYYWILFKNFSCLLNEGIHALYDEIKTFSDKEKLNEYILINKPLLSLKDYDNAIAMALNKAGRVKYDEETRNQLKIIAESKLNNK